MSKAIGNFLNEAGQVTAFPAKRNMKMVVLLYLSEKFEKGRIYTEKEVNALLDQWHTFNDCATLRRELYNNRILERDNAGSAYYLEDPQPALEELQGK